MSFSTIDMATGEQPAEIPLKSKKVSSSSTRSRNDSDSQWLLPNNLELSARAKPSKKQRNKEKHRQYQKENYSSSEVPDGMPCKSPFHNFPQVKCNTTSWLKDQFKNDDTSKRRAYDSEEVFSDSDLPQPHQQNDFPANQASSDLEHQEHQIHLGRCDADNDNIKSVKDELQKRETAVVCEILSHIQEFISEAESSWQQLDLSDEPIIKDALVKLKNAVKDVEGECESKPKVCHLASENGFASGVSPSSSTSRVSNSEENIVNRDSSANAVHCNDGEQTKCNQLHQLKVSDERGESSGSDDCSIDDVGERVAAVEWERRKLKNKLVELQEEKKIKDELLRELNYLQNVETIASSITPLQRAKDSKKRRPGKDSTPSQCLKVISKGVLSDDNQNMLESNHISGSQIGPRHSSSSTSVKRDNVQKEQNSSFPARRHYEAEGRANEDPDIPGISAPVPSPAVDTPEIQDKIRKLKVAQEHLEVIKNIVASILKSKKSGARIPLEQLRLLTPLPGPHQYFSEDSEEDSEPGRIFPEAYVGTSDDAASNVKEISSDGLKIVLDAEGHKLEEAENVIPGTLESVVGRKGDLTMLQTQFHQLMQVFPTSDRRNDEFVRSSGEGAYTQKKNPPVNEASGYDLPRRDPGKAYQGLYEANDNYPHQDRHDLPRKDYRHLPRKDYCNLPPKDSSDLPRKDAGKAYPRKDPCNDYPNKETYDNYPHQDPRYDLPRKDYRHLPRKDPYDLPRKDPNTVPMQDNLQFTRQNIVSVEAQNQNSNSNLHNRDCNSVKKDNINNLSGKMGKLSIQNTMNSSYPDMLAGSNNNIDTMSTFSYELNQNHSLPNEIERKTILDILKQDKKKQKQYERNQDSKMCCNSSVDSEPLEGLNSALALDSSANAAWGGSSTQENFEDENEHAESLNQDDDESVSVFDKGSLRAHASTSQYSSRYSNMRHYGETVHSIPDIRQSFFNHPIYSRNQNQSGRSECLQHPSLALKTGPTLVPDLDSTSAGLTRNMQNTSSRHSDTAEHCNQHTSAKFIQQLKNHIDQISTLCQNQIFHDRTQTSVNCPQSYRLPNSCTPFQPTSDMGLPSNEQLLLCLSQCYHTLYMQQLEIQQLQRCMWQNLDTENSQHQNNLSSRNNHDDSSFRPYSAQTWSNPFNPPSHFPADMSPMSSYYPLPMKAFSGHSNGTYGSVSGAPPARAVIHPTSQNNAASQETLNNQVPPRTRANNFWDNFRSYSRQNLLSTSNNIKRNENASSLVTPQVRQVYPLVTNDSPNRSVDVSNTFGNATSFSEYNRSPPISDVQVVPTIPRKPKSPTDSDMLIAATIPKKAKSNAPSHKSSSAQCFQKKDVPSGVAYSGFTNIRSNKCHRPSLEHTVMPPVSNPSSNLNQQQSFQDNSKLGTCISALRQADQKTSTSIGNPELSNVIPTEKQSDFLTGLFHEAQSLKSDALRQKALRVIRDLAKSEIHDNDNPSQIKGHLPPVHDVIPGTAARILPVEPSTSSLEVHEAERTYVLSDTASGTVQNLPTATIQPLSKHGTPRPVGTGAVRKKPKPPSSCAPSTSEIISSSSASHDSGASAAENSDSTAVMSHNKAIEDVPGFITEKVLSDLVAMLPSLKRRLLREGCTQTFWTFINDCLIEGLRTHLFFCNISLPRKSLVHLRQNVYIFISLFSGIALSDFDSDFLKCVEEFIYENVTCFIANGQFPPVPSSTDDENCQLDIEDKMQDFDMKIALELNDQMKELSIKMPPDESDTFSSQCRTASQQNLLQNLCSYENFIPGATLEQGAIGAVTDDIGCGCNPEAEIEPEVEIGTEADLAEADQSPGQQGNVGDGLPATESWSADQEAVLNKNTVHAGAITLNADDNKEIESSLDGATGSQFFPDACLDQEANLDDIPIKLCPSEEELPQQLKDEQSVHLPSDELQSYSEFVSENSGDGASSNLR